MIWAGLVMGVVATLMMDLWQLALDRLAGIPRPNWAPVGRWAAHLPRGRIFHGDIARTAAVAGELPLGWAFHYGVGIVYGIALALILGPAWLAAPSLLPALIFALLTIGFGWFLLQPGLGAGWAGARTPRPWMTRGLGLAAHGVFGVGLWLGALLV